MTCSKCGQELKLVFPDTQRRRSDYKNIWNGLHILMRGSYWEWYDGNPVELVVCYDCATQLMTDNPFMLKAISDENDLGGRFGNG